MLDEKVAVVPRSSRGPAREGDEATVASHALGTRDEWLAARLELLEAEKELTRRNDELARRRRDLPWVPVEKDYKEQAQLEAENVAWRDWSGEQPGMSAFARDGDDVFHTYSAYARGFDGLWTMWQWLDRAPLGRNEGDLSWFHRHDEYPRPRADRRDTRTYRGDASRGMVDAVHHLRGCRASWHARHDNVGQEHAIGVRHEHTPDRVAAGVGGCAPATAREGEGVDPRP